jgi:regulatory protein
MDAEQAAMRLLAMREHTQFELRNKLKRAHAAADVEQALKLLAEQGLQSDERYTELYVELRRNNGYGPLRIRADLREKGINEVLIDNYVDETDSSWPFLLQQVVKKKYGEQPPADQKDMARRGRFLSYRGFPSHLISAYLFSD